MASQGSVDAKLEAFESRVEDRLHTLFVEFKLGRSPNPTKFQQSASLERPLKKKEQATDMRQPRMREDFPRWEEGDPTGSILRAERYFRHHQTLEDSMLDTAVIHLEGDAIRCCNYHCKKGKLSIIEPIEESEEDDLELEEENKKEDPQLVDCMTHTLVGYVNPQAMKIEESLKQQSVTILIKARSPNDLMNDKVKQVTLHVKYGSEEKIQRLEKFATFTEPGRFHPTRLHDPRMLILQEEPPAHIRLYCCPHP
ncbi:hypothetical protein GW17_00038358 [Ensete ventricosum]|nr:hypothetical protein GW17_00038358 [Ensete ventricosum]